MSNLSGYLAAGFETGVVGTVCKVYDTCTFIVNPLGEVAARVQAKARETFPLYNRACAFASLKASKAIDRIFSNVPQIDVAAEKTAGKIAEAIVGGSQRMLTNQVVPSIKQAVSDFIDKQIENVETKIKVEEESYERKVQEERKENIEKTEANLRPLLECSELKEFRELSKGKISFLHYDVFFLSSEKDSQEKYLEIENKLLKLRTALDELDKEIASDRKRKNDERANNSWAGYGASFFTRPSADEALTKKQEELLSKIDTFENEKLKIYENVKQGRAGLAEDLSSLTRHERNLKFLQEGGCRLVHGENYGESFKMLLPKAELGKMIAIAALKDFLETVPGKKDKFLSKIEAEINTKIDELYESKKLIFNKKISGMLKPSIKSGLVNTVNLIVRKGVGLAANIKIGTFLWNGAYSILCTPSSEEGLLNSDNDSCSYVRNMFQTAVKVGALGYTSFLIWQAKRNFDAELHRESSKSEEMFKEISSAISSGITAPIIDNSTVITTLLKTVEEICAKRLNEWVSSKKNPEDYEKYMQAFIDCLGELKSLDLKKCQEKLKEFVSVKEERKISRNSSRRR